jgi:uncharacterized membrane protein YphA (DoxX/SURF4 family)
VGIVVVSLGACLVAGLIDTFLSGGVSWVFGVVFVLVSMYTAAQARYADRWVAVINAPLVFVATLLVTSVVGPGEGSLTGKALDVGTTLAEKAPLLWVGTGAALVVVILRQIRHR